MIMKKIGLFLSLLLIFASGQLVSCGSHDTPATQVADLIDQAADNMKDFSEITDFSQLKNSLSPEILSIITKNANYKLTGGDRKKLKKSLNKFLDTVKDHAFKQMPMESMREAGKTQIEMMKSAIDSNVDKAETLGDLSSVFLKL